MPTYDLINLPKHDLMALVFLLLTQYDMPFTNKSEATKFPKTLTLSLDVVPSTTGFAGNLNPRAGSLS